MEEVRQAARAYYSNLPESGKKQLLERFNKLDTDGDGAVSRREYADYVKERNLGANLFEILDKSGDSTLDFDKFNTFRYLYYEHRCVLCDRCGVVLLGVYVTCVYCYYDAGSKTYNLCSKCYGSRSFEHNVEGHNYFRDIHSLFRMRKPKPAVKSTPSQDEQATSTPTSKKVATPHLDEALSRQIKIERLKELVSQVSLRKTSDSEEDSSLTQEESIEGIAEESDEQIRFETFHEENEPQEKDASSYSPTDDPLEEKEQLEKSGTPLTTGTASLSLILVEGDKTQAPGEEEDADAFFENWTKSSTLSASGASSSGVAIFSTQISTDQLEEAKKFVREHLPKVFADIQHPGHILDFVKALETLLASHTLGNEANKHLELFIKRLPGLRNSFNDAKDKIRAADQKLDRFSKLQGEITKLAREHPSLKDSITALEKRKGELLLELQNVEQEMTAKMQQKAANFKLAKDYNKEANELGALQANLINSKEEATATLNSISSAWDNFKQNMAGQL